jgi:hypothetical protein
LSTVEAQTTAGQQAGFTAGRQQAAVGEPVAQGL